MLRMVHRTWLVGRNGICGIYAAGEDHMNILVRSWSGRKVIAWSRWREEGFSTNGMQLVYNNDVLIQRPAILLYQAESEVLVGFATDTGHEHREERRF
jgi:hypothetical protein